MSDKPDAVVEAARVGAQALYDALAESDAWLDPPEHLDLAKVMIDGRVNLLALYQAAIEAHLSALAAAGKVAPETSDEAAIAGRAALLGRLDSIAWWCRACGTVSTDWRCHCTEDTCPPIVPDWQPYDSETIEAARALIAAAPDPKETA